MDSTALFEKFNTLYGLKAEETALFFAPGRVNLIGEHTDYNGGLVLPCALSFGTRLLIRPNNDGRIRLATTNFTYQADIPLNELGHKHGNEWVNYPLGVIDQLMRRNISMRGFDLLYSGDIPNGAGLSSSASIEMATAVALNEMLGAGIDRMDLVKIGRAAENEFVGMNCGIMDQFAVGMGKQNHASFLDCRTLEYELVPLDIAGYSIVIANTNKRRELAESKYNERVAECERALEVLRKVRPMIDLSDITLEEFTENEGRFADEIIKRRARHVIAENERVRKAVAALKSGNLEQLGILMNQSHQSLKDDYEVTGKELDTIVAEAQKIDGVLGARMTGAGFGGCSVNIVRNDVVEGFRTEVGENYQRITGLKADFYVASTGNGAGRVV